MAAGRPSEYKKTFNAIAYKVCLMGATDEKLADIFDVSVTTLNNWKKQFPEFLVSIKKGKDLADIEIVQSLFRKAKGYSRTEKKAFMYKGVTSTEKVQVFYPPDTTSIIFWLKNRQKELWRDRQEISHSGAIAHSDMDIDQLERRRAELEAQLEQQRTS